jgi:hypothetical protein
VEHDRRGSREQRGGEQGRGTRGAEATGQGDDRGAGERECLERRTLDQRIVAQEAHPPRLEQLHAGREIAARIEEVGARERPLLHPRCELREVVLHLVFRERAEVEGVEQVADEEEGDQSRRDPGDRRGLPPGGEGDLPHRVEPRAEREAHTPAGGAAGGERPRAEHSRTPGDENDEADDQRVDDEGARDVRGRATHVHPLLQGDRQQPGTGVPHQHQRRAEQHREVTSASARARSSAAARRRARCGRGSA